MRVFVAGASGAVGSRLVPALVGAGHEVVATTTTPAKLEGLRGLGAEPVVLDVLDPAATTAAVREARPDAIVHQATGLSGLGFGRNVDKIFASTNRLRAEGTDALLAAARDAGARRFVAQSFAGWPYARTGSPVKSEDDPLDPDLPAVATATLAAMRHLESAVTGAQGIEGIALRYGGFYGPGTSIAPGGAHAEMIGKRRFPIVGEGTGTWSFIHIDDAATATLAALEHGAPGIYNVADDEPAQVREWLPYLAEAIGAKAPRRLPVWLGRLVGGEFAVNLMNSVRGASNAKAKRELGWAPRWGSWREGFKAGLG
jgi:2-alkyl-3-oxoalkanoate reductase